MIDLLSGSWQLHYSTFPMWHREGVSSVSFNYIPTVRNGKAALIDEVRHLKNGKPKSISGYDLPDDIDASAFTWRGKGLLSILASKWRVEWINETDDCIIISFEKTLVTSAGIDILTKGNGNTEKLIQEAMKAIADQGLLRNIKDQLLPVTP